MPQLIENVAPILLADFVADLACNYYFGLPDYSKEEEDSLAAAPEWEDQDY